MLPGDKILKRMPSHNRRFKRMWRERYCIIDWIDCLVIPKTHYHIEAGTKWSTFRKYFQIHFIEINLSYSIQDSTAPKCRSHHWFRICLYDTPNFNIFKKQLVSFLRGSWMSVVCCNWAYTWYIHPRMHLCVFLSSFCKLRIFSFYSSSNHLCFYRTIPDSKIHGADMRPTWVLSVPDGSHVGPVNLATRDWIWMGTYKPFSFLNPSDHFRVKL